MATDDPAFRPPFTGYEWRQGVRPAVASGVVRADEPGFEVLFSRGIPDAEDWRR